MFIAFVILAALIAFPLRGVIYSYIVAPLSLLWFYLVYYYHVIPQQFYWFLILLAAAYISLGGLLEKPFRRRQLQPSRPRKNGPVEVMAAWISNSNRGVYSRWKVARTLGVLAVNILELRGDRSNRIKVIKGRDWNPPPEIQDYLEAGLMGSYADYPLSKRKTPLNLDVEKVVEYLESQLEMNRDNNQ
jgi:hypothetical protein